MGLISGIARTAVVAGTATAVSNRVSRRQQARWGAPESQQAYHPAQAPPPAPDVSSSLARLAEMHQRGELTDHEYATATAALLSA
jgi:hypothetical protein